MDPRPRRVERTGTLPRDTADTVTCPSCPSCRDPVHVDPTAIRRPTA